MIHRIRTPISRILQFIFEKVSSAPRDEDGSGEDTVGWGDFFHCEWLSAFDGVGADIERSASRVGDEESIFGLFLESVSKVS